MSADLQYCVVGQSTPHRTRVRELLGLETYVNTIGIATVGRRCLASGLLWLSLLLLLCGTVARQRQQRLEHLGVSPIAASEDLVFKKLSRGSCASEGLRTISDSTECKDAAELLGLKGLLDVSPTSIVERPEGCYYFQNATDNTETLWLGTNPASVGKGAETSNDAKGWMREPICRLPLPPLEQGQSSTAQIAPLEEVSGTSQEDLQHSGQHFCCFSSPDKVDVCGTCWHDSKVFLGTKSKKHKHCAKSRGVCVGCGGAWCGPGSAGGSASGLVARTGVSTDAAQSADATSAIGRGEVPAGAFSFTMADFKQRIGVTASSEDAFLWLDQNEDSSIAWKQFYSGVMAFKRPLNRAEAVRAFRGLDADADGLISKEEFFAAFEAGRFVDEAQAGSSSVTGGATAQVGSTTAAPTTSPAAPTTTTAAPTTTTAAPTTTTAAPTTTTAAPATTTAPSTSTRPETTTAELESTGASSDATSTEAPGAARGATPPAPAPTAPPVPVVQPAPFGHSGAAGAGVGEAAPGIMSDRVLQRGKAMTAKEFVRRVMETYSSLQDSFGAFDLDGSGCIDRTEFMAATSVLSSPLSNEQASNIFAGLDSNHDEAVCTHEFFSSLKAGHFLDKATPLPQGMRGSMSIRKFKERMGSGISPQFAFASLDKAADGGLDFNELMEGRGAFRPPLTAEEVKNVFVGFDSDKSNIIESSEFLRAMAAGHFLPPSKHNTQLTAAEFKQRLGSASPRAAFRALDRDANGFVGFMEFVGSRRAFMPPLSDLEAQRIFAGMDLDRDRRVSLSEFETVLSTERFFQLPPRPEAPWTPEAVPPALPPGTPMGAPAPPGSSIMAGMPPEER